MNLIWCRRRKTRSLASAIALGISLTAAGAAHAAQADLIDDGRDLYADMCATCHGRDMVNPGLLSFDLRKFPPDDSARFRNSVQNGKDGACPPGATSSAMTISRRCGPM